MLVDWLICRSKLKQLVHIQGTSHPLGRLHWGSLKDFIDGSLGSRTALMHQPYADNPDSTGVRLNDPEQLSRLVKEADTAGLQVKLCCICCILCSQRCTLFVLAYSMSSSMTNPVMHNQHKHQYVM